MRVNGRALHWRKRCTLHNLLRPQKYNNSFSRRGGRRETKCSIPHRPQRDSEECDQCAVRDSSVCAPQVCALGAASLVERERGASAERAGALYRSHFSAHTLSPVCTAVACVSRKVNQDISRLSLFQNSKRRHRELTFTHSHVSVYRYGLKSRSGFISVVSVVSRRDTRVSVSSLWSVSVCALCLCQLCLFVRCRSRTLTVMCRDLHCVLMS